MSWMENIKRIISPISDEDDDYDEAFDDQESPFVEDRPRGMDRGVVDSRRGKVVNIHATTQLKWFWSSRSALRTPARLRTTSRRSGPWW